MWIRGLCGHGLMYWSSRSRSSASPPPPPPHDVCYFTNVSSPDTSPSAMWIAVQKEREGHQQHNSNVSSNNLNYTQAERIHTFTSTRCGDASLVFPFIFSYKLQIRKMDHVSPETTHLSKMVLFGNDLGIWEAAFDERAIKSIWISLQKEKKREKNRRNLWGRKCLVHIKAADIDSTLEPYDEETPAGSRRPNGNWLFLLMSKECY